MRKYHIYKIKEESKHLFIESHVSEYIIVEEFARHPLDDTMPMYCVYKHIYIDTLDYTSMIPGYSMLSYDELKEHFDNYMDAGEINNKLRELSQSKVMIKETFTADGYTFIKNCEYPVTQDMYHVELEGGNGRTYCLSYDEAERYLVENN